MTNRKRKKSEKEEKKPELEDLLTPPEGAKEVSFEDAALNLINLINFDLNYFRTDLQLLLRLLLKKDNLKLYNYKGYLIIYDKTKKAVRKEQDKRNTNNKKKYYIS